MLHIQKNVILHFHYCSWNISDISSQTYKQSYVLVVPLEDSEGRSSKSLAHFLESGEMKDREIFNYADKVKAQDWEVKLAEAQRQSVSWALFCPSSMSNWAGLASFRMKLDKSRT